VPEMRVFQHRGGAILDERGSRRYSVSDPPGWYFWADGVDGTRGLYGPYISKEDAEFHQEVQNT
jgi:hypothetical protein